MSQRGRERIGGIVILVLSIAVTLLAWEQADRTGRFTVGAAVVGPAFAVVGVALLLIPSYRLERLARGEDLSNLSGSKLITPRWWTVLVVALVAGAVDYVLLKYF